MKFEAECQATAESPAKVVTSALGHRPLGLLSMRERIRKVRWKEHRYRERSEPFRTGDRGSLLVFFSFLIVLIFAAVAFAVDISRLVSAGQEKQNTARFIALSMMERYAEVVQSASQPFSTRLHQEAFDAALKRAVEVGSQNSLTARFLEDQLSRSSDLIGESRNVAGKMGQVESGRWFDKIPKRVDCQDFSGIDEFDPSNRCPCGGVPCFVRCSNEQGCKSFLSLDPNEDGEGRFEPVNAFRVTLGTARERGKGVPLFFARVFGNIEQAVERRATAVMLPRHFVVLQDLSRASAVDSHLYWQKTGRVGASLSSRQPSEFAFRCEGALSARSPAECSILLDPNSDAPPYRGVSGGGAGADPRQVWNDLSEHDCRPGEQISKQCYLGVETPEGSFLVDRRSLAEFGEQEVAQPYTAMLRSANALLQLMQQEHQVGDRVSLLGFGRDTGASRTLTLAYPRQTDRTFQKMLRLTSVDEGTLEERVQSLFFPGADGYFSDLPVGLKRAEEALRLDSFYETTQKHVFLITSGVTTCQRLKPDEKPATEGVPTCSLDYADHVRSWDEVFERHILGNEPGRYQREGISLHVIQVGAVSSPYTIAIRMPGEDRCMKPDEMRSFGFSPVLPQPAESVVRTYQGIGGGREGPYLDGGRWLASAASLTGGMYFPLRTDQKRCSTIPSSSCPPDVARGFLPALDKACSVHRGAQPWEKKSEEVNLKASDFNRAPGPKVPVEAYDSDGRIFCDPMCREKRGSYPMQLEGDVTRFLRRAPLSLVEEGVSSPPG